MRDESTPVPNVHRKDDGIRPAGPPDQCFYCHAKVGNPHAQNCVAVKKVVRMRFVVEIDTEQPFSWTNEHIEEFEKHEGYCLQNLHLAPVISCHVVRVIDPGPTITVRPDTMTHRGQHRGPRVATQRSGYTTIHRRARFHTGVAQYRYRRPYRVRNRTHRQRHGRLN